ncbi:hypothetical protein EST38_g3746 [Candolleomyces aberdarensis]|uniref:Transposase n=1 Tax=Candolleomyces aberdarensis TaxID=2316362 RepID=A0A4V1Q4H6_9AGAR|nr:hypothetical protein EST38_g3746 [Candolleomyces aberdarensis]
MQADSPQSPPSHLFEDSSTPNKTIPGSDDPVQPTLHSQRVLVESDDEEEPVFLAAAVGGDGDLGDEDEEIADAEVQYQYYAESDEMLEEFEREMAEIAEEITDEEIAYLRHFALKIDTHMSDETFEKLEFAFPESPFQSYKLTKARAEFLAQFKPVPYDCCVASCCCFVGPHAELDTCPYCQEPCFDSQGRPRKQFTYVPMSPRLKAFYESPSAEISKNMRYRGEFKSEDGIIQDFMDGSNYKQLREQHVTINDQRLPHKFFDDPRDIALGFSTDGFCPFKRRKKTCWPLLVYNYNLPPEIQFWVQHILCIGVIPGPKKPKDFDSFFWPAIEEFLKLARGVRCLDRHALEHFWLRAYLILCFGDIPAMSMIMRIKGHNGLLPCRMCEINGFRIPDSRNPVHYVPLDRSKHPSVCASASAIKVYTPTSLPRRTHQRFMAQAREVQFARTNAESEKLAKQYGIKGIPILSTLSSLFFPSSFPYDFMHLIFENVMKNLVLLWTGSYKGIDEGTGDYELAPHVWEAIGAATAASTRTIPSAFAASPANIADEKASSTADMWSFWLQYLGPVLLSRKFRRPIYFQHFIELVKLVRICLQFELTAEDLQILRDGFPNWVLQYEKLYYQFKPECLPLCPLTIHAVLHIPDNIVETGPVWTSWAFPTERFCGRLLPAIRSWRHPFANLDNYVVASSQLNQIKVKYDLFSPLSLKRPKTAEIPNSFSHKDFEQWARVRRLGDGDDMRASTLDFDSEDRWDATFVRVHDRILASF